MSAVPEQARGDRGARIALLRGVNVGGVTVTSAALAEVFRSLGLTGVRTVLASGNVVFHGGDDRSVKAAIERALGEAFGYDAWIVLTDQAHVRAIVEAFPFPEREDRQPYVVFGSDQEILDELAAFAATEVTATTDIPGGDLSGHGGAGEERVVPGDGVLYWDLPRGRSTDTAFAKRTAKARYRSTITTRNLRTLRKLL